MLKVILVLEEGDKVVDYSSKLKVVYMLKEYYNGEETLILYHGKYQRNLKINKQAKIISDIKKLLYYDSPENLLIFELKSIISLENDEDEYY